MSLSLLINLSWIPLISQKQSCVYPHTVNGIATETLLLR